MINLKRDEILGNLTRLRNEETHDQHSSPNIIRVTKLKIMRWAGHVARRGGGRTETYGVWVGKHEGKRPLGRPKCRLENNIKMYLQ